MVDPTSRDVTPRLAYPAPLRAKIDAAMSRMRAITAAQVATWHKEQGTWQVDQGEGTITFALPGVVARAPVQIVGTYDTTDQTWLWGWDNPSIEAALTEHAGMARSFGQAEGFEILTERKLRCPEDQCWEFAALASLLGGAQGTYRGPTGTARVFMTFGEVALSRGR